MEYYLAIKRDEVLLRATTENNLGNMLNKANRSQKTAYYITKGIGFLYGLIKMF